MIDKFKRLDIYGVKPEFYFRGKTQHQTVLGSCATMVTLALGAVFGFLFGADFFFRTNPIMISQEVIAESSPVVYPTTESFPLFFTEGSRSFSVEELEEAGLTMHFLYMWSKKQADGSRKIEFVSTALPKKCSETGARLNSEMQQFQMERMFCLDWDALAEEYGSAVPFGGTADDDDFAIVSLQATNYLLDYKTRSLLKFTKHSEILNFFGSQHVSFLTYFPSFYLDVDSLENPIKTKIESKAFNLSPGIRLVERRTFELSQFEDDVGWIFKEVTNYTALRQNSLETEIMLNLNSSDAEQVSYYYQINYLGRKTTLLRRRFMKIQELLAIIGGFVKVIHFVFQTSVGFVSRFEMNLACLKTIGKAKNAVIKENSVDLSKCPVKGTIKKTEQVSLFQFVVSSLGIKRYKSREIYDKELVTLKSQLDVLSIIRNVNEKEDSQQKQCVVNNLTKHS